MEFRYWAATGRVEGIRYMLYDSGVEFNDIKIPFTPEGKETWLENKKSIEKSGYFSAMPVLVSGDFILSQTLAVTRYIGDKLGFFDGFSLEEKEYNNMIAVAAYEDILQTVLKVIWSPVLDPNSKLEDEHKKTVDFLKIKLNFFDNLLGDFEYFSKKEKPSIADYTFLHILRSIDDIIGEKFLSHFFPKIKLFEERMLQRENIKRYIESGNQPTRHSGSPLEPTVMQQLRDIQNAFVFE